LGTGAAKSLGNLFTFQDVANLSHVEARYYKKYPDREIECLLCPRLCKLGDKERGYCGARENDGGTYYTLVYGKACSANVDPIEKKPFFHFLPGSDAFSIATAGCNVNCKFCQNWQISQVRPEQVRHFDLPPEAVAEAASKYGCTSIAYTYTEPVIFFEYMYDSSVKARRKGLRNCVVTGGHIRPEPLQDLLKVVDAIKIDLKAFRQDFYTAYVHGELQPVLDAILAVHKSQVCSRSSISLFQHSMTASRIPAKCVVGLPRKSGRTFRSILPGSSRCICLRTFLPRLFPPWRLCGMSPSGRDSIMSTSAMSPDTRPKIRYVPAAGKRLSSASASP
jgi:pyruvate-formate lyase-activating enzyme